MPRPQRASGPAGPQQERISARWLDGKPPVSGTGDCGFDSRGADRSFVQWEGRGPTNRRRGFDSLSSDERRAIHSPIEGREPAFEAGEAGSTPARGAIHIAVAVVYWRACLAVNEEVRVRSPPVTPQATTGCGSMAGHLARNQVHAGSIPAAQTGDVVQREDAAFASLK